MKRASMIIAPGAKRLYHRVKVKRRFFTSYRVKVKQRFFTSYRAGVKRPSFTYHRVSVRTVYGAVSCGA